jgi:ferrochelatase
MDTPTAVLLLAYGSPSTPDDVEAYFTHIRGGRTPSPEAVRNLRARYEAVGGRTPLTSLTMETARLLEEELARQAPGAYRTYVGMKHWHPYIADAVERIIKDGIRRVIAIVLAPHYSRLSIGAYRLALEEALAAAPCPPELMFVEQWHLQPEFISLIADRVCEGLDDFPAELRADVRVVFSAHSLPERIRQWDDPYEAQLLASCAAVAGMAKIGDWRFAWQSAGHTGEPWLGPDLCEYLEMLHAEGVRAVLSVPIGFLCDHLEVLYDIDREAAEVAREKGMVLKRTRMPNASPELIGALAAVVAKAERDCPVTAPSE